MTTDAEHLEALKEELSSLLAPDTTDYEGILRLAGEIAKREPGVVRFSTDAGMVRRLGRELVAKQETALAELVKNAYDADASECIVTVDSTPDGERMEILDDGHGMTRLEIENGFMRLASDAKVKDPVSPRFHRSRAGKKGIGRFATERLGQRLTIVTQTAAESQAWQVTFDWTAFDAGVDINVIGNAIIQVDKERPHGTRLSIEGLNDLWGDGDLRRVYRYLATLLQPSLGPDDPPDGLQPRREVEDEDGEADPGFSVQLTRGGVDVDAPESRVDLESEVLARAVAVIEAKVDADGRATWSLRSDRLGILDNDQPISLEKTIVPLDQARNVSLRAYYFIRAREFLGHSTSFIQAHLAEHGGIHLYRNGYRVPPYGDLRDDWLGLDYKRTTTYAPLNSKTFLGFVALTDPTGTLFEETSSREGLIATEAFEEVRDIISMVLEAAVRRIESVRGKGRGRKTKSDGAKSGAQAAAQTDAAVSAVTTVINSPSVSAVLSVDDRTRVQTALTQLSEAAQAVTVVARERDELLEELNLLRILASMGLTVAEFTHDFSHLAETTELSLGAIRRAAAQSAEALETALARLEGQFRQTRAYTAHFGNMMQRNTSRELHNIDLYAFARQFQDDLEVMFRRRGLELVVEPPAEYDLFTAKMHPSEWSSILLNLLTNAIKATQRAQRPGKFLIQLGVAAPGTVFLDFSDNGDGIAPENRKKVFDAFYTSGGGTGARASETVQALGTGLGLKILADIVHAADGDVAVQDDAPDGYQTRIRVTVPAGAPDEDDDPA